MYMYSHLKKTYIFASYFFVFGYFCFLPRGAQVYVECVRVCVCVWVFQLVYVCVCVCVYLCWCALPLA